MEFLYALPLLVKAFILGIVEGLTEFLPISSTGHLILAGALARHGPTRRRSCSTWRSRPAPCSPSSGTTATRIGRTIAGAATDPVARRFAINVAIAFLPAAVIGVLFASRIKAHLFKPVPVALAFIVGGVDHLLGRVPAPHGARSSRASTTSTS